VITKLLPAIVTFAMRNSSCGLNFTEHTYSGYIGKIYMFKGRVCDK